MTDVGYDLNVSLGSGSLDCAAVQPPSPSHSPNSGQYNPDTLYPSTFNLPSFDPSSSTSQLKVEGNVSPPLPQGGAGAPPPMISFDPNASHSDGDEEGSDDDSGRPRKRKSVANLRGAAAAASGSGAAKGEDEDKGRRKIQIEYIEEKSKRHITFSKRKAGIMKKAYELSTLTGTQVLLLVVSESGWVYTFTTDKFKPLVKEDEHGQLSQGQKLIAACLEAKEGSPPQSYPATIPANAASFEANSAIHGGQIALKTNNQRSVSAGRPMATNRRVSAKGRVPPNIRTDSAPNSIPPVPHLPTPMSAGYLDPHAGMNSPLSPRGPRSMSHPPPGIGGQPSPAGRGLHPMQHAQMMAMAGNAGFHDGPDPRGPYDGLIPLPPHEGQYQGGQGWPSHDGYDMHSQQQQHYHQQPQLDHFQPHHYGPLTPASGDGSAPHSAGYPGRSFSQQQQLGLGQRPSYDYGQPQQEEYVGQR